MRCPPEGHKCANALTGDGLVFVLFAPMTGSPFGTSVLIYLDVCSTMQMQYGVLIHVKSILLYLLRVLRKHAIYQHSRQCFDSNFSTALSALVTVATS